MDTPQATLTRLDAILEACGHIMRRSRCVLESGASPETYLKAHS